MSKIKYICSSCGNEIRLEERKNVRCDNCGGFMARIPEPPIEIKSMCNASNPTYHSGDMR